MRKTKPIFIHSTHLLFMSLNNNINNRTKCCSSPIYDHLRSTGVCVVGMASLGFSSSFITNKCKKKKKKNKERGVHFTEVIVQHTHFAFTSSLVIIKYYDRKLIFSRFSLRLHLQFTGQSLRLHLAVCILHFVCIFLCAMIWIRAKILNVVPYLWTFKIMNYQMKNYKDSMCWPVIGWSFGRSIVHFMLNYS